MSLKPGKLYRLLTPRILWTADLTIWPTTAPNSTFELAKLNKNEIVMVIDIVSEHALVLYKNKIGRLVTYANGDSILMEEIT